MADEKMKPAAKQEKKDSSASMVDNKEHKHNHDDKYAHNHASHEHSNDNHIHHTHGDKSVVVADNKDSKAVSVSDNNEVKKEEKTKKPVIQKKEEAIAKGTNMPASKKHCMYICSFIKNKSIDRAMKELSEVTTLKRVIPFKGEIPHRSAPGIMSGRYPVNASKQFIYLLKALKGNAIVNGLDLSKTRIYFASATWDSRPGRRGGTRFKRAFVLLKAKEFNMKEKIENKGKNK